MGVKLEAHSISHQSALEGLIQSLTVTEPKTLNFPFHLPASRPVH